MKNLSLKVAIVHDDFVQTGGAERLVLAMLEIWPEADLYSLMASENWKKKLNGYNKKVFLSWLDRLPFKEKFVRFYYFLCPIAVESFVFDDYDLVISSSARYAHGVITKPKTLHVAYVNSPARFLWQEELVPKNPLIRPIVDWHRAWDKIASQRPDFIVANSKTPAERMENSWNRRADGIVYPFLETSPKIEELADSPKLKSEDYFLVISRLNKWKRIDLAVQACKTLGLKLYIIGDGPDRGYLEGMSQENIRFLGRINETDKYRYLLNCRALIVTQEEDFGIVILEANACGKPVIAFRKGGALELIRDYQNGLFFDSQSSDCLVEKIKEFHGLDFSREKCIAAASPYSKERFKKELFDFVDLKTKLFRERLSRLS